MALPATIQTIVSIIGHGPAMEIVRAFGGQDFRFPARPVGANWEALVEIIGERLAGKLQAHFPGDEVYIALCDRALRADRDRRMIARYEALLSEGHSSRGAVSILVQEFRPIANRTVEKIVNGPVPSTVPEMETQGSLF
jgi:hypothetical protein